MDSKVATDKQIAEELNITHAELIEWQSILKTTNVVSLNEYVEQGSEPAMDARSNSHFQQPETAISKKELKKVLAEALEQLTDKEKKVILLYYYEEMTLKEISATLEVSESRVSQLHTKALGKMKSKMGDYMDVFAGQTCNKWGGNMNQVNGYIQVEYREDNEAFLIYYPPKESGEKPDYRECSEYLKSHGFENYDNQAMRQLILGDAKSEMSLGVGDGIEFIESMSYKISLDKMKVTCRFYPPSTKGNCMNAKDILGELGKKGVKYGIDQDLILEFIENRVYFTDFVIAEGLAPVHGVDDKIEYFFNTNPNLKPKHNEDGSVDYHSLDTISHVNAGDLLATLHPMNPGQPGSDVFGKVTPPRSVKNKKLEYGRNISISEDGINIY